MVSANLDRQQTQMLLTAFSETRFTGLGDYLDRVATLPAMNEAAIDTLIQNYAAGTTLSLDEAYIMCRLLGIYARLQYGDEAMATLARLVAIPTFQVEGVPQHENPEFQRFAAELEEIATGFGLAFRNVDNRVYEITLEGEGNELIGLHAHADVVPVNPDLWVLEDGTRLDPFNVATIGNRMYGRGTEDDKNGIVVALYAMRVIQEESLPLFRNVRLLVDTTEETSSEAIPYYFESNPVPAYNLALDGGYPVIIAEKGYGTVMASFPVRAASGEGAEIINMTGGLATNQIPAAATATLRSTNPAQLADRLNRAAPAYIARVASNGGIFSISAAAENGLVRLQVDGVSAHSSAPGSGINPVSRMLDFLYEVSGEVNFKSNQFSDAVRYGVENFGLDYTGERLGISHEHDFMGPLTAALTFIAVDDERLRLATNLRVPAGLDVGGLRSDVENKLNAWAESGGVVVNVEVSVGEPMYRNPEGDIVNALLDVATENLGLPREFGSSGGATSIHNLPNGMQFGLSMPGVKYTGHNANEFKTIDQFLLDLQIVTEMMIRIGNFGAL